ncbi:glucose-1-phosphate thymidylyltransferase [candidate division KSB1 bacterium]|nr:MAG: glucose-1-phosphate thymidylyltransferase [candidate division KSB1 bacterium]
MQVVMMVAGKSTRTYPLTLTCPKPLLKIANKPIIEYNLEQLEGLADEVILIVGYRQEMIRQYLGDRFGKMKLIYQDQREQRGTGHAILQAKPWVKGPFIAMNGDDLFARQDIERLLKYSFAALVKEVPDPSLYGVYELTENGRVVNLIEKPKTPVGNLANIGCYLFQPSIFDELERTPISERGEIEITSAVASIAKREEFYVVPIKGFWLPTGYAWHLLDHQEFFLSQLKKSSILGKVEQGVTIHGAVQIGKGTIVKNGTYIEGPVIIGENCQIGPNCYLRKYTTIGHHCRIGQGVEIKNSILMDEVFICHLSYVGDSVIGNRVNLGAGTIVANRRHDNKNVLSMIKGELIDTGRAKLGTIIGDGAQTGIHTSIYPGRKLWPGKCTRPGEVVSRDLV